MWFVLSHNYSYEIHIWVTLSSPLSSGFGETRCLQSDQRAKAQTCGDAGSTSARMTKSPSSQADLRTRTSFSPKPATPKVGMPRSKHATDHPQRQRSETHLKSTTPSGQLASSALESFCFSPEVSILSLTWKQQWINRSFENLYVARFINSGPFHHHWRKV